MELQDGADEARWQENRRLDRLAWAWQDAIRAAKLRPPSPPEQPRMIDVELPKEIPPDP